MTGAQRPTSAAGLDFSELVGGWLNAHPEPACIESLLTRIDRERVLARIVGVDRSGPVDWGEAPVGAIFTDGPQSATVAGCLVDYDLGFARAHLQVQLKLGVAVVGSFLTLPDSRGFVREFLGRLPASVRSAIRTAEPGRAPADPRALQAAVAPPTAPDELVAGRWLNTAASPTGLAQIEIETSSTEKARVRIWERTGSATEDWGEEPAEVFGCVEEDRVSSVCLLAHYRRSGSRIELQIRQNKGVLAVTSFTSYLGKKNRFNHVGRELFCRTPAPPGTPR